MNFKLAILFMLLIGCETTVDLSGDLPYNKQLVISGVINPDLDNNRIQITKTIPGLEELTNKGIKVENPNPILYLNNVEYKLKNTCENQIDCHWFDLGDISNARDSAFFTAEIDGKVASAQLHFPSPEFDYKFEYEIKYDWFGWDSVLRIKAVFDRPIPYPIKIAEPLTSSISSSNILWSGASEILFREYYDDFNLEIIINELKTRPINLSLFQKEYEKYLDTRFDGDPNTGFLSGSTLNVEGNIENGIGFLIGKRVIKLQLDSISGKYGTF